MNTVPTVYGGTVPRIGECRNTISDLKIPNWLYSRIYKIGAPRGTKARNLKGGKRVALVMGTMIPDGCCWTFACWQRDCVFLLVVL